MSVRVNYKRRCKERDAAAATVGPLKKSVLVRKWALLGDRSAEQFMNAGATAVVCAALVLRLGRAAPILARLGYDLVERAFEGQKRANRLTVGID